MLTTPVPPTPLCFDESAALAAVGPPTSSSENFYFACPGWHLYTPHTPEGRRLR